jgi:hypothetical protein
MMTPDKYPNPAERFPARLVELGKKLDVLERVVGRIRPHREKIWVGQGPSTPAGTGGGTTMVNWPPNADSTISFDKVHADTKIVVHINMSGYVLFATGLVNICILLDDATDWLTAPIFFNATSPGMVGCSRVPRIVGRSAHLQDESLRQ